MPVVSWRVELQDLEGNFVADLSSKAVDRRLSFPLNGVDALSFSIYLDDPVAPDVRVLDRVVKVWRTIDDPDHSIQYYDDDGTPCFSGYIVGTTKQGAANSMSVSCFSPFWRLQTRFHTLNHLLVKDFEGSYANEDNEDWDQSALMWRLIKLVNGTFGANNTDSRTGIVKPLGSAPFWPKTVAVAPYRVAKGSSTWQHIFDDLMNRVGGCDLVPRYIDDGTWKQMYFETDTSRGVDNVDTTFDYCTGVENLIDLTEDTQIAPGKFANYVWAVGQGGPNVSVGLATNPTGTYASGRPGYIEDSPDTVGIYMHQLDEPRLAQQIKSSSLNKLAASELKKVGTIPHTYSVKLFPGAGYYFAHDYGMVEGSQGGGPNLGMRLFGVGDLIELNAAKGALVVNHVNQRIYEVDLIYSDNCVESVEITLAEDFYGKIQS